MGGPDEAPPEVHGVDESLRFVGSAPTLDELGSRVLAALAKSDMAALERIRLTEQEHNRIVWPELPASAPEVNFPVDYAWANIENRNRRGLDRIAPLFANRTLTLRNVECRGRTETFATFRVATDCFVVFGADGSPELWEVQLFKDVVERGGGHKIFRYYDEEPRPWRGAGGT